MRQYVGYVSGGRRFIYANAVHRDVVFRDRNATRSDVILSETTHKPFIICDGGTLAWSISYVIDTGEFVALEINGV